jgi:DNA modification methylase
MDRRIAQMMFTDPPYGIGESYKSFDDTKENLKKLIDAVFPIMLGHSERILLTPGNSNQRLYPLPNWTLCWFTAAGVGSTPWGFSCWTPILAYGKDPYLVAGLGRRPDALAISTESAENDLGHPVSKPVKVWTWLMERGSVNKGDIIFDCFSGSGTGYVAAENLGRIMYGIELDAGYCAVILERLKGLGLSPRQERR